MHQYFVEQPLYSGEDYVFTKEQAHHAEDVLHMNHTRIRLVNSGHAYYAETFNDHGTLKAHILEQDPVNRDLPAEVTLAMCLIRREKFELVLQKAAETGAARIIPVISEHTIVQIKKEKKERLKERWNAILQEASEQCKRNTVPVLNDIIYLEDLKEHLSDQNFVPYEKAGNVSPYLSSVCQPSASATVVIGPEGGFSQEEIEKLMKYGYEPVTLGHRILRAETAAVYACSVLAECIERNSQ